jgi:hypothetical protein
MATFEENLTRYLVSFDSSWNSVPTKKQEIIDALRQLINVDDDGNLSGIMADYWSRYLTSARFLGKPDPKINLWFESNEAAADNDLRAIKIDPAKATDTTYITSQGNVAQFRLPGLLAHELLHVLEGVDDNNSTVTEYQASYLYDVVTLTNPIFEKLGMPLQVHYLSGSGSFPHSAGTQYTGDEKIDIGIVRSYHPEYLPGATSVDTSKNDDTRDLLIGRDKDDILISGGGKDWLYGFDKADTLYAGDGDDTLNGGELKEIEDEDPDQLFGGNGDDTYYVGTKDIITDSDGEGKVIYAGYTLMGGTRQPVLNAEGKDISGSLPIDQRSWLGSHGEVYRLSVEGVLTVTASDGAVITINEFSIRDTSLGIRLTDSFNRLDLMSPLILDLDGDGIETVSVSNGGVFFDVDKDGLRERTGWVGADDGLLALDRNNNGRIDSMTELFGYGETLTITHNIRASCRVIAG